MKVTSGFSMTDAASASEMLRSVIRAAACRVGLMAWPLLAGRRHLERRDEQRDGTLPYLVAVPGDDDRVRAECGEDNPRESRDDADADPPTCRDPRSLLRRDGLHVGLHASERAAVFGDQRDDDPMRRLDLLGGKQKPESEIHPRMSDR